MGKRWKYFFYISIALNILFVVYGVRKTYWKLAQWKKSETEKLAEVANSQRDTVLVDKEILRSDSTAIILTLGQSNAANYGQGKYVCRNKVFNYFNGNVYKAIEPLLGAEGEGCSVWTRLADRLIDRGGYKKVILIPLGVNGSSVDCWANGTCHEKLLNALMLIKRDSIRVTHVIWHQGEADNAANTTKEVYKASLHKILFQIRENGIKANFYVCVASYYPFVPGKADGIDTVVQNAQKEFVKEHPGTKPGPNTDQINLAFDRWNDVHFSKQGLDKFSAGLYNMLVE